MKIFHRIDDIKIYNSDIKMILDFFEKNTKNFIVAVIPYKTDKKLVNLLNSYKHCEIYQHGFKHVNKVNFGWFDEFPDYIPYHKRYNDICSGKKLLENLFKTNIIGYVPPWNNTSKSTIDILYELGFKIYSAQDNNTFPYIMNKDICIDIVDKYLPNIVYKDLSLIYNQVKNIYFNYDKTEIGIMYHFENISNYDWKKISNFIIKIEKLNYK